MSLVHQNPTVKIHPTVQMGENIAIGQNVTIESGVIIGDNCILDANSYIGRDSILGSGCHLYPGAVVGTPPQDLRYKDEFSRAVLGNNVQVREYATVHRGTGEGTETNVGDGCLIMAYAHVGHNSKLGKEVIMANGVQVGGHVEIGDYANIGGMVAIHQFVRIGRMVMMSGFSATRQDVPPFAVTDGRLATIRGINKIGLKRRGVGPASRTHIKEAYKRLWFDNLPKAEAIKQLQDEYPDDALVYELLDFVLTSKRGIRNPHLTDLSDETVE
jgi:UDP-N-acetylglucosamine acyltransferase